MIWIIIISCLFISFLFSGIESGVLSVNRLRLRHYARTGDQPAQQLEEMLKHIERLMITVVLVTSTANILAIALLFQQFTKIYGEWGGVAGIALCTPALVIIMEFLPKAVFRLFPYRALLPLAKVLGLVHLILRPFVALGVWVLEILTHGKGWKSSKQNVGSIENIRRQINQSQVPLSTTEKFMIDNVLEFRKRTVASIMISMEHVISIPPTATLSDLLELAKKTDIERFPVTTANGEVLGLLQLMDFLATAPDDGPLIGRMRRIVSVVEQESSLVVLQKLRAARLTLALVTTSTGKPLGIVASEDLIRVLLTGKAA
ncbi:MAG: CNNM domain-containing protein [Chthoniobacterales bacterium]